MNQYLRLLYTSFLGIISGFLGGLLGVTGTIILLPLLTLFSLFSDYSTVIGTVLFSFEPVGSIFSLIQYAKEKKIDYLIGINMAIAYIFGSYLGTKYHKNFSEKTVKNMTGVILLILSIYMFYNAAKIKS